MKKITILLAEDHTIFRECFRRMLELETDFKVVCEVQNGRQAVLEARRLHPSLALMDITMPLLNGLDATREIRRDCPRTKVIILSAHHDELHIHNATECGAHGFLFKQASLQEVRQAIREVQKGGLHFNSSATEFFDGANGKPDAGAMTPGRRHMLLTSREAEVLQLIAQGKANKQTAVELGISSKTVEKHRHNLMAKLNIHDTANLTRHAIEVGLVGVNEPGEFSQLQTQSWSLPVYAGLSAH